jgi:hypothetical protein
MTTRKLTIASLTLTLAAFAFAEPASAYGWDTPRYRPVPAITNLVRSMTQTEREAVLEAAGVERAFRVPAEAQIRMLLQQREGLVRSLVRRMRIQARNH